MAQTTSTEPRRQRRLHALPVPNTEEEVSPSKQALITALREHLGDGATSSVLAEQAGIGQSTARRLLSELVEQGRATRTPGSGGGPGRTPDRFRPADDLTDKATTPTGPGPLGVVSPPDNGETTTSTSNARDDEAVDGESESAGNGAVGVAGNAPPATASAPAAVEAVDAERDTHGPVSEDAQVVRASNPATAAHRIAGSEGSPRLGKNALRGKVEQYLIEHPEQEFGPHALSQLLGHSSGAITNVLIKLVRAGLARQTQTHPRRFAASTHPDT